jgi:hypothetical protein
MDRVIVGDLAALLVLAFVTVTEKKSWPTGRRPGRKVDGGAEAGTIK